MGRYTWIKLYTEILDDPKMGMLPVHLKWRTIELFLLAGKNGNDGVLQPVKEMAWALRSSEDDVRKSLMSLAKIGVVREVQPDLWKVVNFTKRQAAMTATERSHKFRDCATKPQRECNEKVAEGEEEGEEEREEEPKPKKPPPAAAVNSENPFKIYEQNIGMLTETISEKIKLAEKDYPPEWIPEAIRISVVRNKRRWDYVEGILRKWQTDGKDSGEKKKTIPIVPIETELMRRERLANEKQGARI